MKPIDLWQIGSHAWWLGSMVGDKNTAVVITGWNRPRTRLFFSVVGADPDRILSARPEKLRPR